MDKDEITKNIIGKIFRRKFVTHSGTFFFMCIGIRQSDSAQVEITSLTCDGNGKVVKLEVYDCKFSYFLTDLEARFELVERQT